MGTTAAVATGSLPNTKGPHPQPLKRMVSVGGSEWTGARIRGLVAGCERRAGVRFAWESIVGGLGGLHEAFKLATVFGLFGRNRGQGSGGPRPVKPHTEFWVFLASLGSWARRALNLSKKVKTITVSQYTTAFRLICKNWSKAKITTCVRTSMG